MQMSKPGQKTTVSRIPILLLLGVATLIGSIILLLLMFNMNSEDIPISFIISFCGLPLVILGTPLFMFGGEKRESRASPKWLEFFLAGVGAVFPPAILMVAMWALWWIIFGFASLVVDGDPFGIPFNTASIIVSLLALVMSVMLVRVNWRNMVDQLYPVVGNTSAFAQLSRTSKLWLVKRGLLIVGLFLVGLPIIFMLVVSNTSEGDFFTIGDYFLMELFFFFAQIFLISISAWLWLRKPPIPQGLEVAQEVLSKALIAQGYQVLSLRDLINQPERQDEIDEEFVASVDLIAQKEGHSMVIDILTPVETLYPPEWSEAAEFKTAVWYLSSQLNLPSPVEARFVFVDVTPAESLLAFTEAHDIQTQSTTNNALLDALVNDAALQQIATSWFAPPIAPGGQS